MKYWVYKDSRILGPFDKEGVSGLPGLDAGTLVCAGDPDRGGAWTPVGELSDLASAATAGPVFSPSDFPSGSGLLDRLQIETAGLIGDADFPALAEDLFQDASLKQGFADILSAGAPPEGELRRAKETSAALTAKLEAMYKRMAELEASNAELLRRLEAASAGAPVSAGPLVPPPQSSSPVLPPAPATAPPEAPPPFAGAPTDWPQTPSGGTIPSFASAAGAGAAGQPAPEPPPALMPGFTDLPAASVETPAAELPAALAPASAGLPEIPSLSVGAPPPPSAPPPLPEEPKPKAVWFGKPKRFKVAPTIKSFKVISAAGDAQSAPPPAPAPASAVPAPAPVSAPPPAPSDLSPTLVAPQAPPPPSAEQVAPPPPASAPAAPPPPAPAAADAPVVLDAAALDPLKMAATPAPAPAAPVPVPEPVVQVSDLVGAPAAATPVPSFSDLMSPATPAPPPQTLARSGATASASADDAAARFAKPGEGPATEPPKKSSRSNKPFLFAGAALVILLAVVGAIFLRQPKDLKQMTTLDDGAPPIGLPSLNDGEAPPSAKARRVEEPAPAPAPPPEPAPASPPEPEPAPRNAELDAAVELVKEFPLDGERGTVGRWLQYSYTASPGAGPEEWTPSSTADGSILVEYRVSPSRGKEVSYLFEVDSRLGLVIGKSLEARQMLAGSPPAETKPKPKAKPKAKARPKPKPRPEPEEEREVPLLPLPDSGELRPPAEDDGSFGADTINSGL